MKNLGLGAPRTLATVSEENALEQVYFLIMKIFKT
jgi:hypothetical protein